MRLDLAAHVKLSTCDPHFANRFATFRLLEFKCRTFSKRLIFSSSIMLPIGTSEAGSAKK